MVVVLVSVMYPSHINIGGIETLPIDFRVDKIYGDVCENMKINICAFQGE